MEVKENISMETAEEKDEFSFRPQREQRSIRPQQITLPKDLQRHPKSRPSEKQRSRGFLGNDGNNFPLLEFTDHIQAQVDVEEHFNKHFTFTCESEKEGNVEWKLPAAETLFTEPVWQDEELQAMKISLNKTKQQLSNKDIELWHSHTNNTNPTQKISHAVRRRAQPEMVTQAWLKFYEIVNAYPIVPLDMETGVKDYFLEPKGQGHQFPFDEDRTQFNSVHLCEAPGAFILALNHYLVLNRHTLKWQWLGNTLNPYYEGTPLDQCITEERFIYLTLKNWSFGRDNTGDVTIWNNLCDIVDCAQYLGPIHLVTADGSFDCQATPAEQEKMTHCLHLCEAVAAMHVLAPGGSLVIKKFTFFENETLNLMYLLCCVFESVHVYKPGTSKQGNSEVYVIALNYHGKGKHGEHLKKLSEVYGPNLHPCSMFAQKDIPENFIHQIRNCAAKFKLYQVNTIMRNISLFQEMPEREKQYNELLKVKATALFFERNFCEAIPKYKTITDSDVNKSRNLMESDWNKTESALLMRSSDITSKLEILNQYLKDFLKNSSALRHNHSMNNKETVNAFTSFVSLQLEVIKFEAVRGKPFQYTYSSKFCSEKATRIYCELHRLWMKVGNSSITFDDSLLSSTLHHHSGALLLRGETTPGPHSGCLAIEEALVLLEEEGVSVDGSIVLFDVPLLSRLQYGLLLVLGSAFKEIRIYTGQEVGKQMPVLVLHGLKSVDHGVAVVRALNHAGWTPNGGAGGAKGFLQIVGLSDLLQHEQLQAVFHYNIHYCTHHAVAFYENITNVLG